MLILQAENNTLIEIEAFLKKCWEEDVFDAFRSKNEPFFSRFISGDAIKKKNVHREYILLFSAGK